jgi:hypothetical protein
MALGMTDHFKKCIKIGNYRITVHAFARLIERNISLDEIEEAILFGEFIENYPKDKYGPSCFIWGKIQEGRILHVQCSMEPVWIITAYDPTLSLDEWEDDFKRRQKK